MTPFDGDYSDPHNRWWETQEPSEPSGKPHLEKYSPDGFDYEGLPIYVYGAGKLHESVSIAERLLIQDDVQFFDRGGSLVRPIIDEVQAIEGRSLKSARLTPVTLPYLMKQLSASIRWKTLKAKKEEFIQVNIDPPAPVAASVLSDAGDWPFHKISGVITAPTLRRDGSILWREGYDPQTKLLLVAPPVMPDFPQNPSKRDAEAALRRLDALLDGFPFLDPASRSVALSGLLTPIARAAMTVSPLHVISAPSAGSGKSFLVDICSALISGNAAPVMTAGKSEEEMEKRLSSVMMSGSAIMAIDNVNGQLYGDALCQCVERPVVKFRVLGESRMVEIENKTTIFATGNNISLVDDMARRSVLCNLDPNTERPELREFDENPLADILNNRGQYIADALTVVRAYKIAGSPGRLRQLASFGEWSDLIRSALVWLGRADPLDTMKKVRDADGRLASFQSLVALWWAETVGQKKTAAEIVEMGMAKPDFQVAMRAFCNPRGNMDGHALGNRLRTVEGRIVDGLKLRSERDTHRKISVYWLEKVADDLAGT